MTGLERSYYEFSGGGHRFIVVDGNEISTFATRSGTEKSTAAESRLADLKAAGAPNAQTWNGGISDEQFTWMLRSLLRGMAARRTNYETLRAEPYAAGG